MCTRHSFVVTKQGKVLDGLGLTNSHTQMMSMHGLASAEHDTCNLYEWQPPKGWPDASWLDGLTVDLQAFVPKASHDKAAEKHLRDRYPDMAAWDAGDSIDPSLDGRTIDLDGKPTTVLLSGTHSISEGRYVLGGSVVIDRFSGGTVAYMYGGTVTYMYGGTVTDMRGGTVAYMYGGTVTDMRGSASITDMRGSASITLYALGGAVESLAGDAIIIDRYNGFAVYTAQDVETFVVRR